MAQRGAAVHCGMTLPANSRLRQNRWGQTVMRLSGPNHMRMRGRQQHAAYLPSATATLATPEVGFGREPRDPRGHGPANHRNVGDSDAQSHGDERRPHGDVHGGQGKHDDDRDDGEAEHLLRGRCAGVILCGCSGMAPETKAPSASRRWRRRWLRSVLRMTVAYRHYVHPATTRPCHRGRGGTVSCKIVGYDCSGNL